MSQQQEEETNNFEKRSAISMQDLSTKSPAFMIGVPRCHENLFQIIRDNHEWLSDNGEMFTRHEKKMYRKKINTEKEFKKLESIILALRTVKSEIFIDNEYHPKPERQKTVEYIAEFLRNKSIGTYYTFKTYYRITVYPYGFDFTKQLVIPDDASDEQAKRIKEEYFFYMDQRKEYIIVPLYIILKRGKTYDQMKTLSYNPDGTFNVNKVNANHFMKMVEEGEEEEENEEVVTIT